MEKIRQITLFLYRHPFIRYLFVGGTSFIIDFSLLFALHGREHINLAVATSIAYWISIAYNFSLNRWWTFSARDKTELRRHITSYLVLLGFNYLFTLIFVGIVSHSINYLFAKVLAVAIQISWTYLVYKNVIFRNESTPSQLLE